MVILAKSLTIERHKLRLTNRRYRLLTRNIRGLAWETSLRGSDSLCAGSHENNFPAGVFYVGHNFNEVLALPEIQVPGRIGKRGASHLYYYSFLVFKLFHDILFPVHDHN